MFDRFQYITSIQWRMRKSKNSLSLCSTLKNSYWREFIRLFLIIESHTTTIPKMFTFIYNVFVIIFFFLSYKLFYQMKVLMVFFSCLIIYILIISARCKYNGNLFERISELSRFRTNGSTFAGHCLETRLNTGHRTPWSTWFALQEEQTRILL